MSTENRKTIAIRLEGLKAHYVVTWGELAERIGIARSMIDFLRFGKKEAGPKVLRRIIEAERAAGLLPAEPPHPTPGETHAQGVHALETVAPADRVARGARRDDRLRAALRKVRLALDELEKALEG